MNAASTNAGTFQRLGGVVLILALLSVIPWGVGPVLAALAACLGGAAILRWPEYALALLIAGTLTNIFGVASNSHGLPGLQALLTVALAFVLLARWLYGAENFASAWMFAPLFVCAFCISLLSLIHVEDFAPTVERLNEQARDLATAAVIVAGVTTARRLRLAIVVTVASMGLIALLSVKQYVTGSFSDEVFGFAQASIKQIAGEVQRWRVSGSLPDANYYGQVLVITLPLACGLVLADRRWSARIGFAVCAVAILSASLFTFSRGAVFATGLMAIAAMLTLRTRWWLLGATCALVGLSVAFMPSAFIERIALVLQAIQIQLTGEQAVSDPSLSGRIAVMNTALRMFADHPVLGIGLGQYSTHYTQYALASGLDPGAAPNPHSLYLEVLAEEGVAGLLKLAGLSVIPLLVAFHASRDLRARGAAADAALVASLCISFIGYLATAIFLHGAFLRFFWIEIALLLATWQVSASAGRQLTAVSSLGRRSSTMMQRALMPVDVLGIVRSRKLLIGSVTLLFMLVPVLQGRQYAAESTLLYRFGREYFPVRPGEEHRNWGENVQVSLDAALFTEMHLLRSREVIEATVANVGLDALTKQKETAATGMHAWASDVAKRVRSLGEQVGVQSASDSPKRVVDPVVSAAKDLAERLRIRRVEGAALIAVGIQDAEPEVAERIITAHVESYLRKRQQLFERDPSKFYSSEIEKAQAELASIAERINSLRIEQGVPDETVEQSVLSDRLIALERQRQSMRQAEIPVLQDDLKETRQALFDLKALTATTRLLEARYRSVAENLERMLQEQNRWRLDNAYVRELGPTIEIVEPAAFSARPSGPSGVLRAALGGAIGFMLVTGLLIGSAFIARRRMDEPSSVETAPVHVKIYSKS